MRSGWLLWLLAAALPALPLVATMPAHPMIMGVLNDAAHAPLMGAFAIVMLFLLRRRPGMAGARGFVIAFVIALAVGGAIELIQPLIGRDGQLRDFWTDALGAAGGLGLAAGFLPDRRLALGIAVFLMAFAVAGWPLGQALLAYRERARQMPVLLDFDSRADWYFLRLAGLALDSDTSQDCRRGATQTAGIRVRITGGPFPGLTHLEPFPDWSGFSRLNLDLTNPEAGPLALTLRVHDAKHDNAMDDRFNLPILLAPSSRVVTTISLTDIAAAPRTRRLQLENIAGVVLFAAGDPALIGREFCINRLWLD